MSCEIQQLLASSVKYCGNKNFSQDVLSFLVETVTAIVEDETFMKEDEALTMLLDAGLGDLDEEELHSLASTISLMTGCDDELLKEEANGDKDVPDDDGTCELCERDVRRTFHHLIPKETHNRYLKKKTLPENITAIANEIGIDASMSRVWLNTYGTMICSSCHSAVHRAASNEELAEKYNTVELLLEHPQVYAFAKYNSKQPVRNRCDRGHRGP